MLNYLPSCGLQYQVWLPTYIWRNSFVRNKFAFDDSPYLIEFIHQCHPSGGNVSAQKIEFKYKWKLFSDSWKNRWRLEIFFVLKITKRNPFYHTPKSVWPDAKIFSSISVHFELSAWIWCQIRLKILSNANEAHKNC